MDPDITQVAALIGEPTRARVLAALGDGRSLPASVLAAEAGVAPSTAGQHLARLVDAGLLHVTTQGRHRYYRLAGGEVAEALEALARVAPPARIRSLREGTRAPALRRARTCYDHLAGRLGVAVMAGLIERGAVAGHDGRHLGERSRKDRLSAPGWDVDYRLGPRAGQVLASLGVDLRATAAAPGRRPLVRYCVDWSEQRHHLAGRVGAALVESFERAGWIRRARTGRVVYLTDAGGAALAERLGVLRDQDVEQQVRHAG